ncbi:MAG TPA: acyl carrier protein [Burkholderiaceae bacterium]|nr:acyl carrier protein [Burkholderiaceae bacterium]
MNAPATPDAIRQAVIESVLRHAPEVDFSTVKPDRSLREQLDLDSFDYLNILIALHAKLGVEIPEADYGRVSTLNALVDYLVERLR